MCKLLDVQVDNDDADFSKSFTICTGGLFRRSWQKKKKKKKFYRVTCKQINKKINLQKLITSAKTPIKEYVC